MNAFLEEVEQLDVRDVPRAPVVPPSPDETPLERLVMRTAGRLSVSQLSALLRAGLGDLHLSLCLHRVRQHPCKGQLSIPADHLDELLALLHGTRPAGRSRWLTVAFDDGYDDAAQYVGSRAPRYPDVEWLVFVCPRRSEQRLKFPWDQPGQPCELASVETLRRLAELPNVSLGNHTNVHDLQTSRTYDEAQREYVRSIADFTRLFGPQRHFAFPYGTPGCQFDAIHVAMLRRLSDALLWSTERRPYEAGERRPGAVLPRLPIENRWSPRQIALWLSVLALKFRTLGTRFHF